MTDKWHISKHEGYAFSFHFLILLPLENRISLHHILNLFNVMKNVGDSSQSRLGWVFGVGVWEMCDCMWSSHRWTMSSISGNVAKGFRTWVQASIWRSQRSHGSGGPTTDTRSFMLWIPNQVCLMDLSKAITPLKRQNLLHISHRSPANWFSAAWLGSLKSLYHYATSTWYKGLMQH